MTFLALSSLMALSSPSWLVMWVCLEMNMVCMCLILGKESDSGKTAQHGALSYLIPQALGSMVLLSCSYAPLKSESFTQTVLLSVLIFKMGAWPAQSWYMGVLNTVEMSKTAFPALATWQKLIPLCIISMLQTSESIVVTLAMASVMMSTMAVNSQASAKSVMVFSSLFYNGWALMLTCSLPTLLTFLTIYWAATLLALKVFSEIEKKNSPTKKNMLLTTVNLSNLSGLPPLSMFSAKVLALSEMLSNNLKACSLVMIMSSCVFIFSYMWAGSTQIALNHSKTLSPQKNTGSVLMSLVLILSAAALFMLI